MGISTLPHHLGARVADLDGDGDREIVSIAWDAYQYLHLWRHDVKLASTTTDAIAPVTSKGMRNRR